jgi:intron-binding protein aquarius
MLWQVGRLKETLNVVGDVAYTCETASYFFLYHVLSRWEKYLSQVKLKKGSRFNYIE